MVRFLLPEIEDTDTGILTAGPSTIMYTYTVSSVMCLVLQYSCAVQVNMLELWLRPYSLAAFCQSEQLSLTLRNLQLFVQ